MVDELVMSIALEKLSIAPGESQQQDESMGGA
jgi:hypothetical protein